MPFLSEFNIFDYHFKCPIAQAHFVYVDSEVPVLLLQKNKYRFAGNGKSNETPL